MKVKQETPEELEERGHVNNYMNACKLLGIMPVTYLARHINDKELVMKSHPLGPAGTRAVCIALVVRQQRDSLLFFTWY